MKTFIKNLLRESLIKEGNQKDRNELASYIIDLSNEISAAKSRLEYKKYSTPEEKEKIQKQVEYLTKDLKKAKEAKDDLAKLKSIKEGEVKRIDEGRTMDGYQAWVFNFQINHLIENLKKNDILRDYIERGEQSRFYIPMDDKQGYHPYLILGDEISKELNKTTNDVTNALKEIGQLKKRDSKIANSPIIYSDISGLRNFKELMNELFYELGLNVDEDTAKKIYAKYKDNSNVQGPTSGLFDVSN